MITNITFEGVGKCLFCFGATTRELSNTCATSALCLYTVFCRYTRWNELGVYFLSVYGDWVLELSVMQAM